MWRYLAGGGALLATAGAGVLAFAGRNEAAPLLPPPPAAQTSDMAAAPDEATAPEASPATREQRRFNRYDKDRDGAVTRDEYLASRRKAFAKLDADGDGRLGFDEWAVKATAKFAGADRDRWGAMNAAEFATTAVRRKPAARAKCPPAAAPAEEG